MNNFRKASFDQAEEVSDPARLVREPLVSVLMLTFNHAAYIRQAVESVLVQQTAFQFELLIGEDSSTDETREIVLELQKKAPHIVRVIAWNANVGMHHNFAALIEVARGEFIAFCEGDDYWLACDKLQVQFGFMREHPECGLVHGNYLNLIRIGGTWRTRLAFRRSSQLQHRSGAIYPAMLAANRIQTCTVLCRRGLVADYRRDGPGVDRYMVGDWPLFLYLTHQSGVGFIERPLAAYRQTPGSIMNSGHQAAVERGLDAIRMAGDFCDFFRDNVATREAALAAQNRALLGLAFRAGDVQRFKQAWAWLAQYRPGMLSSARARAMRATVGVPAFRKPALGALAMIESIKHRIEFRRVDTEPLQ